MALRKKLAFIRKLNLNPLSNLTTDGAIEREREKDPDIHYQNYGHYGLFPVIIYQGVEKYTGFLLV